MIHPGWDIFVKTEDAYEMMTRLAKEEGLWVGLLRGCFLGLNKVGRVD